MVRVSNWGYGQWSYLNGRRDHGRRDHSQVRPNDVTDHADQWGRSRGHRQSALRSRIRDHSIGLDKMSSQILYRYILRRTLIGSTAKRHKQL